MKRARRSIINVLLGLLVILPTGGRLFASEEGVLANADSLVALGQVDNALSLIDNRVTEIVSTSGTDNRSLVTLYRKQGLILYSLQRYVEAEPYLRKALDQAKHTANTDQYQLVSLHLDVGAALSGQGRTTEAVGMDSLALQLYRGSSLAPDSLGFYCRTNLMGELVKMGDTAAALSLAPEAADFLARVPTTADTLLGGIAYSLAKFAYDQEELSLAARVFLDGERFYSAAVGPTSSMALLQLSWAASSYRWDNQGLTAESLYHEILARCTLQNEIDSTIYVTSLDQLGNLLQDATRYDSAATYHRAVLEWHRQLHDTTTATLAAALENLANDYYLGVRDSDAVPLLEEAIAYRERYPAAEDLLQVAIDCNRIGNIRINQDRTEEAAPYYRRAVACYDLAGDSVSQNFLTICGNLGSSLYNTDPAAAESLYIRLVPLLEHFSTDTLLLVNGYNYYGLALLNQGKLAEAETQFRLATETCERLNPGGADNQLYWHNLAIVVARQGRLEESDLLYQEAINRLAAATPIDTAAVADLRLEQGGFRSQNGDHRNAEAFYRQAYSLHLARGSGASSAASNAALLELYEVQDLGDYDRADSLAQVHSDELLALAPGDTVSLVDLLECRALISIRQGNYETAAGWYAVADQLLSSHAPTDSVRIATNIRLAGWCQLLAQNYIEANSLLQDAHLRLSLFRSQQPSDTAVARDLAEVCTNLGKLNGETGQIDSAMYYYQEAMTIAEQSLPPNHVDVVGWQTSYVDFLAAQNRYLEAEPILQRLRATTDQYYEPDDTTTLKVLTREAMVDVLTGRVDVGQQLVRQVLETRRRIGVLSGSDLNDAMILLAIGHKGKGNYVEAEQLLTRIISQGEGQNNLDATTIRNARLILGDMLIAQWKLATADSLFGALLISDREQFKDYPRVGNAQMTTLANLAMLQGRFDDAARLIDQYEEICKVDSQEIATWGLSITVLRASLSMLQGDYRLASERYRELLLSIDTTLEELKTTRYSVRTSAARAMLYLRQYASADSLLPTVDSQLVRSDLASAQESFEHVVIYGHLMYETGRLDAAAHYYQKVIDVVAGSERRFAANYAEAIMGLARIRLEQQDYRQADSLYAASILCLYQYLGEKHPLYCEALLGAARVKTVLARFSEAGERVDKAIATIKRIAGSSHPLLAKAYDVQGLLFAQQARFIDAESSFVASRRILGAYEDQKKFGDLIFEKRMAELAATQQNSQAALLKYGEVIGPLLQELGPFHTEVVSAFLQGAEVLLDMGLYFYVDTTLSFFDAIKDEELGQRVQTATGVQLIRGKLAMARGDFAMAERQMRSALNRRVAVLGTAAPALGECYSTLGALFARQNRYDEAERALKQAIAIYRASYGDLHPLVAQSTLQLAKWHRDLGDFDVAEPLFREALQTFEHIYGTSHAATAAAMSGLADLHRLQGHYDEAEALYLGAYSIDTLVFGSAHPTVAADYVSLGDVSYALARVGEADTFYMAASVLYQGSHKDQVLEMIPALIGESRCAIAQADWPRAIETSYQAFQTAHKGFQRNALALSEADALAYSRQIADAAQMYLTAYLRADTTVNEWTERAVDIVLQVKGQVSEEIFNRHRELGGTSDPELLAMNRELQEISLEQSRFLTSGLNDAASSAHLDSLNARARQLESDLALRSSESRPSVDSTVVSAAAVTQHLPEGACLVEYFVFTDQLDPVDSTRDHYLAILLEQGRKPRLLYLGSASVINDYVSSYRRHMAKASSAGYTLQPLDAAGYVLKCKPIWETIWKPLERLIDRAKLVIVAPDAALNLVSFAALKDSAETYLIEKYPIHYLSSGRDLLRFDATAPATSGLFAMGDPDYSASPTARIKGEESTGGSPADSVQPVSRNVRSSCGTLAGMQVAQLPSTHREVDQIIAAWRSSRGGEITSFFGARASEDNIKRFSPGHRVVHIATHGFYLSGSCGDEAGSRRFSESPLLQSGLLLAGANLHGDGADSAGIDDGILTAEEVVNLPLNGTQLVVLSACETGLGEVKAGEGVYGLRRAFLLAGARTVISSLWPVPDKETAAMMSELYSTKETSLPVTLRAIQLERLKQMRESGAVDHPFSWGAFIILGNWKQ